MQLQPVRGTQDLLPELSQIFRYIDTTAYHTAQLYGFSEIVTPIFEFTNVFLRTLGETSDMVSKEMYTFNDRGGDSLTLRPEGTAGVARAVVSNGLAQHMPLRLYYSGPMFRYERPQKGRYRQFNQIGVETLGIESSQADIESIALGNEILQRLGLNNRYQLEINTIGDKESRKNFREKLVEYFSAYKSELSADSLVRLEKNPLRILDSKDEKDKKLIANAPLFKDHMNRASKEFFDQVLEGLQKLKIPYVVNPLLVRGIDYYCHSVFEFTTTELGSQSAILAGGRYEGLVSEMGGPETPGVGWASGVERLALLVDKTRTENVNPLVSVIAAEDEAYNFCLELSQKLRQNNFRVDQPHSGNMGKKMKRANKLNAKWALIVGGNELKNNSVTVKNLNSGTQSEVTASELIEFLNK